MLQQSRKPASSKSRIAEIVAELRDGKHQRLKPDAGRLGPTDVRRRHGVRYRTSVSALSPAVPGVEAAVHRRSRTETQA